MFDPQTHVMTAERLQEISAQLAMFVEQLRADAVCVIDRGDEDIEFVSTGDFAGRCSRHVLDVLLRKPRQLASTYG